MARYVLRDDGYSFKKIMSGRKWVGRVVRRPDGSYYARIGVQGQTPIEATRPTEVEAFEQVAAQAMGYTSAEELHARNRVVRKAKRIENQAADMLYRRVMGKKGADLIDAIDRETDTPEKLMLLLKGFTRDLSR